MAKNIEKEKKRARNLKYLAKIGKQPRRGRNKRRKQASRVQRFDLRAHRYV